MSKKARVVSLVLLSLLSACGKKVEKKKMHSNMSSMMLYEAKYLDVPTPIGYRLLSLKNKDGIDGPTSHELRYVGFLDIEKATNFYRDNMERLGWDLRDLSSNSEGLLFCKKHGKSCAISIRSGKRNHKSKVCIFLQSDMLNLSDKPKDINSKQLVIT